MADVHQRFKRYTLQLQNLQQVAQGAKLTASDSSGFTVIHCSLTSVYVIPGDISVHK